MTISVPEYTFRSKYRVDGDTGCWVWKDKLTGEGYGRFRRHGRPVYAHRYSYIRYRGAIPETHVVVRTCDTVGCVNPEHLDLMTKRDNFVRGNHPGALAIKRQKCKNGHSLLDPENVHIRSSGARRCKTCARESGRRYRARLAARAASASGSSDGKASGTP